MINKNLVKLTILLSASMTIMAGATIAPSLPQMSMVFNHIPNAEFIIKLVLTLPSLFIAFAAPFAGYIIDRVGRKKLLLFSLLLYAIAGTSGLYLNNMLSILIGRALLGVSVAGIMTTATTLIADYYTGIERHKMMGLQGAFMAFGGVVFICFGGYLADISWRMPFIVYAFSLIVFLLVLKFIYEPKRIIKYTQNNALKTSSKKRFSKKLYILYFVGFIGFVFYFMIPVEIPFLLNDLGSISNTKIGYSISISILAGAIVALNYSKIKIKLSYPVIYTIIFCLMCIGFLIISFSKTYLLILTGLMIQGAGFGILMPNTNSWIVALAPKHLRGRLIGNLSTAVYLGQFLSPVLIQPLINFKSINFSFGFAGIILFIIASGFLLLNHLLVKTKKV